MAPMKAMKAMKGMKDVPVTSMRSSTKAKIQPKKALVTTTTTMTKFMKDKKQSKKVLVPTSVKTMKVSVKKVSQPRNCDSSLRTFSRDELRQEMIDTMFVMLSMMAQMRSHDDCVYMGGWFADRIFDGAAAHELYVPLVD